MAVPKVNEKLLEDLEAMGFPQARASRALHYSGNTSLEDAITWIIDHENDTDINDMPLVDVDIDIETSQSFPITEEVRMKAQKLREQEQKRKANEEKTMQREREKERIEAGKKLVEAKRIAEENERKLVNISKAVYTTTKVEHLRECLRSLRRRHQGENARVRRAFETLLVYVGNVVKNPNEEKYRKIRLSNPLFQDRVGSINGGVEFLELCGFERKGDFLYQPHEKVDMELLSSAGFVLNSALTNPFFGLLST